MLFKGLKAALAIAGACAALTVPGAANAAETLQVDAGIEFPRGVTVASADPIGQTFTAFTDTLTSVGFEFTVLNASDPNTNLSLAIYAGEALSGTALFSTTFLLPATLDVRDERAWVDLAIPDLAVAQGQVYSLVLNATSNRAALLTGPGFRSATGQFYAGESYEGGKLITNWSAIYANCKGAANNCDANFRVTGNLLAAAVPEPSTWALMIVGFGAVGATIRRRKPASSAAFA